MKYNPQFHHRRSIRLKGYDYSRAGAYFITICCANKECRFGKIENHEMILNEYGTIAYNEWNKLPTRFLNFELDVFRIMPNHMHGIIILKTVGATLAVAPLVVVPAVAPTVVPAAVPAIAPDNNVPGNSTEHDDPPGIGARVNRAPTVGDDPFGIGARVNRDSTVGDVVGAYKSLLANNCLDIYKLKNKTMGKLWQRNYYEHIIQNEQSYQKIYGYIINNPKKWNEDKFFKG